MTARELPIGIGVEGVQRIKKSKKPHRPSGAFRSVANTIIIGMIGLPPGREGVLQWLDICK